jgi:hypothetical protein
MRLHSGLGFNRVREEWRGGWRSRERGGEIMEAYLAACPFKVVVAGGGF